MKNSVLSKIIKAAADPARALHFFDLLTERLLTAPAPTEDGKGVTLERFPHLNLENASEEQLRLLAALFSGSQASANLLVANPDWADQLDIERLRFPRRQQGLRSEINARLQPALQKKDYSSALNKLRQFKHLEMVRIAARDLGRLANVPEITREISDVADVCLDAVFQICRRQFIERFGVPYHQDVDDCWQPTEFCVLGMGKLGGQELNYSSDVDVLFVYTDEGRVFKKPPGRTCERQSPAGVPRKLTAETAALPGSGHPTTERAAMSNHQFFSRLAETFIAEVSRMTGQGSLYRIDLRLRPEGNSGPLCRSLGSYENYYAQWGQTWERMMLIKARGVAGSRELAAEFLETIQAFRYPRDIGEDVLREVAAMKDRIENEVLRSDELDRNVKLGRGGIREIEFIVQARQLIHAGRQPFLQGSQTLPALEKFLQYDLISGSEARSLRDAYHFLRDIEHRLQMDENLQTHTLPQNRDALERLARLMNFQSARDFESVRLRHTTNVRASFDKLLKSHTPSPAQDVLPAEFAGEETKWKQILTGHAFRDPDKAFQMLREFVEGPGYVHVSPRTAELARRLLPKLFALCPKEPSVSVAQPKPLALPRSLDRRDARPTLSDPDRVITRIDSFVAAYGARSPLFELWNSNPTIFELLVKLFDRSEFLAELAIRTPDLLDDLVTSGRLRRNKPVGETLRDLRHGLKDEDQLAWLRRYHQVELMRIGLRDILGLADPEQYLTELSALADACLQYALDVVMQKNKLKSPPFVIIGLGKLGGLEIDYGSDLDIVFVTRDETKDLRKLQRFATELMELISNRTELGIAFRTDARLRPDGEKGMLVNTLGAFEEYYRKRAQLWEIQSLTRTRTVGGDMELGEKFQSLAAELTGFRSANLQIGVNKASATSRSGDRRSVACYSPDWKSEIHKMRMRIEKERTPAGKDELAIKTGKGGFMDAEFIAQALCLENGWHIANTLRALERGRETKTLPDADKLIANYRELRRVEGILRRWSYEGETVLPDDPAPYYRVSVRCGFETPEKFRQALAEWRKQIRDVYEKVF